MLVTGASSGIGRALALAANRAGATIVAVARREQRLVQLRDEASAPERIVVHAADLMQPGAVDALVDRVRGEFDSVNILVNNAGSGIWKPIDDTTVAEAEAMMRLPYLAAFELTRSLLPSMLQSEGAHIVNVTSAAAYLGVPGATAYSAARWAMRGFTHALAADLARTRVRVSLAYFAKVDSEYWHSNPGSEEMLPGAQSLIPTLSSDEAAEILLKGIAGDRAIIRGPWRLGLMMALIHMFPPLETWLVRGTGYRRP